MNWPYRHPLRRGHASSSSCYRAWGRVPWATQFIKRRLLWWEPPDVGFIGHLHQGGVVLETQAWAGGTDLGSLKDGDWSQERQAPRKERKYWEPSQDSQDNSFQKQFEKTSQKSQLHHWWVKSTNREKRLINHLSGNVHGKGSPGWGRVYVSRLPSPGGKCYLHVTTHSHGPFSHPQPFLSYLCWGCGFPFWPFLLKLWKEKGKRAKLSQRAWGWWGQGGSLTLEGSLGRQHEAIGRPQMFQPLASCSHQQFCIFSVPLLLHQTETHMHFTLFCRQCNKIKNTKIAPIMSGT